MADVPTTEPKQVRAGDVITWKKSLSDYPATTYTLSYRLINGANTIDIVATADGDDHLIEIPSATSADYVAGEYTWFSFVTTGTPAERTTLSQGTITVLPDIATATEFRSEIKQALDAMKSAIVAYGTKAYTYEYQIAGRLMRFKDNADFISYYRFLQSEYQKEVIAQGIADGTGNKRRIGVRFRSV